MLGPCKIISTSANNDGGIDFFLQCASSVPLKVCFMLNISLRTMEAALAKWSASESKSCWHALFITRSFARPWNAARFGWPKQHVSSSIIVNWKLMLWFSLLTEYHSDMLQGACWCFSPWFQSSFKSLYYIIYGNHCIPQYWVMAVNPLTILAWYKLIDNIFPFFGFNKTIRN